MKKREIKTYDHWNREQILVTNLFLDSENIRLNVKDKSQDALITDLFANEDVMEIIRSIVQDGFFKEPPIVIKESGKTTVIEGNRRVAALKIIQNPSLLGRQKEQVEELIENVMPIKKIEVWVAPNRQDIDKYLASIHTKVTRRPWRLLRQAYFYEAQIMKGKTIEDLKKDYPNVDIVKFIKMWELHKIACSLKYDSPAMERKVHSPRDFPVSTLERLYNDPSFRDHMGFDFDDNGLIKVHAQRKTFEETLKNVVTDAVDGIINTRKLGDEKQRKTYYQKFSKLKKSSNKTMESSDFIPTKPEEAKRTPNYVIPKDILSNLHSPGIERRLNELKKINYKKFPNAVHDFLRSFLELSLKRYLEKNGKSPKRGKREFLEDALSAIKAIFSSTSNLQMEQVVMSIQQSKWFLHAINHNPSVFSTQEKVKEQWDEMEPLIRYVLQ